MIQDWNDTKSVKHDQPAVMALLESELRQGLERYWQVAETIFQGGPVQLVGPTRDNFSLSRNFFSTLFLYSYYRCGIPSERRILYIAVNQCLRGMVTGCDNILDDEYKTTLETDLPPKAHRFRSVLDIMVSDRILFAILLEYCTSNNIPTTKLHEASKASLQALIRSGAQEASEEGGISERLSPEKILSRVHHYKTGMLFQCTWAIPRVLEDQITDIELGVQEALYRIGMGCQIFDDMVDLCLDLRENRHNYVASSIVHEEKAIDAYLQENTRLESAEPLYARFPEFHSRMKDKAIWYLKDGLAALFAPQDAFLVDPAIAFIAGRIGVTL